MYKPSDKLKTLQRMSIDLESDEAMADALCTTVEDLLEEVENDPQYKEAYHMGPTVFLYEIKRKSYAQSPL